MTDSPPAKHTFTRREVETWLREKGLPSRMVKKLLASGWAAIASGDDLADELEEVIDRIVARLKSRL